MTQISMTPRNGPPTQDVACTNRPLQKMPRVIYIAPERLTAEGLHEATFYLLTNDEQSLAYARKKGLLPLNGGEELTQTCRQFLEARI